MKYFPFLLVLFIVFVGLPLTLNAQPKQPVTAVSIGIVGDQNDVEADTQSGVVLMGGSTDVDEALQWMIKRSGGGDFVIIRASGSTGYNDYIKGLGNLNSVETLLIDSRAKANLPETGMRIREAEALFIAGGDQANYVNFWANTEVSKAIQFLIEEKKVPIGGTSAGCAILSEYCFDARKDGIASDVALSNPYDTGVSLSKSFISLPVLKNIIADQHYAPRKRQGRHVVFMARLITDFDVQSPIGIGVDEKTAVAVDDDGSTKVFGTGAAYFLYPTKAPEVCKPGQKLTWNNSGKALTVFKRNGSKTGTEGVNVLRPRPSIGDQNWTVIDGRLEMHEIPKN